MKMHSPGRVVIFFFLFLAKTGFGQDPQFSQFFANPVYLNPALAGTTDLSRVALNYRDQWPQRNGTYTTFSLSLDGFIRQMNGGLGIQMMHDRELDNVINTSTLSFAYSYHIKLGEFSFMAAGLQAGMVFKQLNTENLVFPGMINQ